MAKFLSHFVPLLNTVSALNFIFMHYERLQSCLLVKSWYNNIMCKSCKKMKDRILFEKEINLQDNNTKKMDKWLEKKKGKLVVVISRDIKKIQLKD